jgi:hypothetical protein
MLTGTVAKKPGMAFRNVYSTLLLIFCTVIVMAVIIDGNTKVAASSHPSVAIIALWLCIIEGGQASLVGLPVRGATDSAVLLFSMTSNTHSCFARNAARRHALV